MNTSTVGVHTTIHHRHPDPETAGLATRPISTASREARLERVRADRALILEGWEPARTSAYAARPALAVGTTVFVGSVELPSTGYADADEPAVETGPVDPGPVERADVGGETGGAQGVLGVTSTVTKRELSFLDDRSLSIEEKLFRFLALMTTKADQELVAMMKDTAAKKSTSSSGGSSGSSSGSSGPATPTDPTSPGGGTPSTGGGGSGSDVADGLASLAAEYTGPALGLVATALGFPELAPVAKAVGDYVGPKLGDGIETVFGAFGGGGSFREGVDLLMEQLTMPQAESGVREGVSMVTGTLADSTLVADATQPPTVAAKATGSGSASSASTNTTDERLQMLNLQRLVEKQNAMFAALSNVLKSLHETRMAAVQNLR